MRININAYAMIAWKVLKYAPIMAALAPPYSQALTVLSGPTFSPATNAPLAGSLFLTTDAASLVSIFVTDGVETWQRDFFDYGTNHTETLLGFKPNRTNEITVTVRDQYRNTMAVSTPLTFITDPLPADMPAITLRTNNPALMEPGYTLFHEINLTDGSGYVIIVDSNAEVVWYAPSSLPGAASSPVPTPTDIKQLTNGDLFFPVSDGSGFMVCNMLGQLVQRWYAPYLVDSHEDLITGHGTILYLHDYSELVSNFPSSATDPDAPTETTNVNVGAVVEMGLTNSALLNYWPLISMLDPVRIDYLCFQLLDLFGIDPEHANAIIESTNDDSLIVSMRNQDAVIKFSRSGQLKWILGPPQNWGAQWHPYLLTPVGAPFQWNYGQHAPILTPQGTLLLYDDGNCRAEPFDPPVPDAQNYSRAVEFQIDETNMQVAQVWQFADTNQDRLYTTAVGNALLLPQTGNVLVTFGQISYENGASPEPWAPSAYVVRIKEVTHQANPSVVFDLEVSDPNTNNPASGGYQVYRSHRIPDLHVHPANPVATLTALLQRGRPVLQFTADPALTYMVESSPDLVNWTQLGAAVPEDEDGDFYFVDDQSGGLPPVSFYRVLTE